MYKNFLDRLGEDYCAMHSPYETARDFIASLTDSAFLRLFTELFVPKIL